jgi:hypothetical protein
VTNPVLTDPGRWVGTIRFLVSLEKDFKDQHREDLAVTGLLMQVTEKKSESTPSGQEVGRLKKEQLP